MSTARRIAGQTFAWGAFGALYALFAIGCLLAIYGAVFD